MAANYWIFLVVRILRSSTGSAVTTGLAVSTANAFALEVSMKESSKPALAPELDLTKLFGFARVTVEAGALEDAIGIAFNKRGTETVKAPKLLSISETVPLSSAARSYAATETPPSCAPTEGPTG